jgi:hypothetical protein
VTINEFLKRIKACTPIKPEINGKAVFGYPLLDDAKNKL